MTKRLISFLALAACLALPGAAQAGDARVACAVSKAVTAKQARTASRYIGETEKNLVKALSAGEMSASLLLFDEADALFGKRTEVRDSHDRYANIETSYVMEQGGARLDGFSRRAFSGGFDRRAPAEGLIALERKDGVVLLRFKGVQRARAISLARAYDRACG